MVYKNHFTFFPYFCLEAFFLKKILNVLYSEKKKGEKTKQNTCIVSYFVEIYIYFYKYLLCDHGFFWCYLHLAESCNFF